MRFLRRYIIAILILGYNGLSYGQTANTNYLRTRIPKIPVTDVTQLDTIGIQRQMISIQYIDGLGRPLQQVQVKGSPTLHDIILPYEYDFMGRAARNYLPYAYQGNNNGQFRSNSITEALNFYKPASPGAPKMAGDSAPYSQTVYEKSPLERVTEQGSPGSIFQPSRGHSVKASYQVNVFGDDVYRYHVDSASLYAYSEGYAPGTLSKTIVTDENGQTSTFWKDLQGHIVTREEPTGYSYSTDYIYDDMNRLAYILPPDAKEYSDFTLSYIFHYDSIGRQTERRGQNRAWVYTVYNHSNQPVLVQDSNLRAKHQWLYMKYDAEDHLIQTGIYTNTTVTSRTAMQHLCDSNNTLWETWQPGVGYTNNAFPQSDTVLYMTRYYDDYSFPEAAGKPFQTSPYGLTPTHRTMGLLTGTSVYVLGSTGQYLVTVNYYDSHNRLIQQEADNHLGLVDIVNSNYNFIGELLATEQKTQTTVDTTITIRDRYVSDHMGRLLDTWESFRGQPEIDISHNTYNEIDQKVSKGLHSTGIAAPGASPLNISRNTSLSVTTADIARESVTLNDGFSFTASDTSTYVAGIGSGSAQTEEFRYNIRGWLTNINNGTLRPGTTQSDSSALFGESITYWEHSPLGDAVPQYNGNISGITWRNLTEATGSTGMATGGQGYSFTYDEVNRYLNNSYYHQAGGDDFDKDTNNAYTEQISGYDFLGTITSLERLDKDGNDLNNFVTYPDYGGRLDRVSDSGNENISSDYTYDGNGNLITDGGKGITISYNYLNLPDTIKQNSTNTKMVITYDAVGNKLNKKLINAAGTVLMQRHYIENIELTATTSLAYDGRVESIGMAEGRIVNNTSGYQYEYDLQDHLGSNRVSFMPQSNGTIQVSSIQNYYPFGRNMGDSTMNYRMAADNRYLYQDKEWQSELGMNTYDFGVRQYDPVLAQWTSVDPMATSYPEWSPYNYTLNNPINMVDPDGMQPSCSGCNTTNIPFWGRIPGLGGDPQALGNLAGGIGLVSQLFGGWHDYDLKAVEISNVAAGIANLQGNTISAQAPGALANSSANQGGTWPDPVNAQRISQLDPRLQGPTQGFLNLAHYYGTDLRITQGYRSIEEQNKFYSQGRTTPGPKITNAKGGQSYHQYGLAFDVVVMQNGVPNWNVTVSPGIAWLATGIYGFEWGGNFNSIKDYPHFQMTFGQTWQQLYQQSQH